MNNRPEPVFVPGELVVFIDRKFPQYFGMTFEVMRVKWLREEDGWDCTEWGYWCGIDYDETDDECWTWDTFAKLPPSTPATFDAAIWAPSGVSA